jgi:molybdopterin-containing oxidoreductase family iron-sulfur binding subunit
VVVRADYRATPPAQRSGLELDFVPSPTLYDGRFANNVWLLELPSPVTKLSWDNALLVGPKLAGELDLESEDVVEIAYRGRKLEAAVLVVPAQAKDSVTLHLGWGRSGGETHASSVGVDANRLRTSDAPAFGTGIELKKLERKYELALTQTHWSLENRPHALTVAVSELGGAIGRAELQRRHLPSLLPEPPAPGAQWAMSIDLSKCFGCSACVIACQAENNVPSVGKKDVRRSREMYWLRIDTYYSGAPDAPDECVPSSRRPIVRMGSTRWFTTDASARGSARTTAPTRCAASTGSSTEQATSGSSSTTPR